MSVHYTRVLSLHVPRVCNPLHCVGAVSSRRAASSSADESARRYTLSSNNRNDRRPAGPPGGILLTRVSVNRQSGVREFDVIGTSCFVLSEQNPKPEVTGIESRARPRWLGLGGRRQRIGGSAGVREPQARTAPESRCNG